MRRHLRRAALVSLVLAGGIAGADEPPKPPPAAPAPAAKPAPPPTNEQAADAVLAASKAKDDAGLRALAARNDPDPWLVADELIGRGEFDAADAFAKAAPRVDVEKLPAYVASRRGKPSDPARRARVDAANAANQSGRYADALEALGAEESGTIEDVLGSRIAWCRGAALFHLARLEAACAAYRASGEAAERLGWWSRAIRALITAGQIAGGTAAHATARDVWLRVLPIFEKRGEGANVAATLLDLGNAYESLGDHANALAAFQRCLTELEALGDRKDPRNVAICLDGMGIVHLHLGNHAEARTLFERALALAEELGEKSEAANALNALGILHGDTGEDGKALSSYEKALAIHEALGNKSAMAASLVNIGGVLARRGDHAGAIASYKRGLALADESGQRQWAVNALVGLGSIYRDLEDTAKAMPVFEDLLARRRALKDPGGVAFALAHVGSIHEMRGEFAAATAKFEAALAMVEATGNKTLKAATLNSLGIAYLHLGEYAKALAFAEQALGLFEAMGDRAGVSGAWVNLGSVYFELGDYASARSSYERGRALADEIGHRQWSANALANLGRVYAALGDTQKALETWTENLRQQEALGRQSGVTSALVNIGLAQSALGRLPEAIGTLERALARAEAFGIRADVAATHGVLGDTYVRLGEVAKARASFESAGRIAKSLRNAPLHMTSLADLAALYLRGGESARALGAAREALLELENMVVGLSEEQGARVREVRGGFFALGTVAAVRQGDVAEALTFLESGRAGALLDALGSRDVARWKAATLSDGLRAADAGARTSERAARMTYDAAVSSGEGDRAAIRAAGTALDDALRDVREVNDRVEREGKRGAGLYYPRAKSLEDIEAALGVGEALVLYGLCLDEALALVVTPTGARAVALGPRKDVQEACAALDGTDPKVDVLPALARLTRLVVVPLALGDDVKRVVVSPEGPLGYLPFGAIFDRPVAMTPSGTTLVLLHDEGREPGEQVLALGDPDYGEAADGAQRLYFKGRPLARLPATREEAKQIGTTTLLGAAASESGLRSALAGGRRWRAVHFACHGLLDPERPTLSSLALSKGAQDDGFLTALEVLRMEIPSDLVVLSACETGKGKIVGGEGIVGLTRAFMQAGSSRVICSLWKVDDEATRALMVKFYELWNPKDGTPGLPTAEALKKAQEFVRSQEKWKHPYYWAAWVLWGLPA